MYERYDSPVRQLRLRFLYAHIVALAGRLFLPFLAELAFNHNVHVLNQNYRIDTYIFVRFALL